MSPSATPHAPCLSTVVTIAPGSRAQWRAFLCVFVGAPLGCGWHFGPPPAGEIGASVVGATLDIGLRAGVEAALARREAQTGAGSLVLSLTSIEERPQAAVGVLGTVAWLTAVVAEVGRPNQPECGGEIRAERLWVAADGAEVPARRAEAIVGLADELARRAAIAVEAKCP